MSNEGDVVLVTGGSGYIGLECIKQLLAGGWTVRTTVRSLKRSDEVRNTLKAAGVDSSQLDSRLNFVAADLTKDEGWTDAVKGCKYVLHVASPFPAAPPKHEDELVIPAREGTLRVLKAAREAGVKRVVVTSSFAAIGYGDFDENKVLTEKNWSDDGGSDLAAYQKSKTVAERAAWDFVEKNKGLELAVINPVGVFGPVYSKDSSTSIQLVQRLINGSMPALPRLNFGIVDVRDVAALHIKAMTNPKANGERFLAVSEMMWMLDCGKVLRERMGTKARKVPTRTLPSFVLRLMGFFDPAIRLVTPELDKEKKVSNEKARTMLDWTPIPPGDSLVASAEDLIRLGVVKV